MLPCALPGSVTGAFLGYYIGYALYETVGVSMLQFYGVAGQVQVVLDNFRENVWLTIFIAGFTPIPFLVFTIAAGFRETIDLTTFFLASLVGRGVRFFLVGTALYIFGPTVKEYIDKYLERLTLVFGAMFVAGIVLFRWIL